MESISSDYLLFEILNKLYWKNIQRASVIETFHTFCYYNRFWHL